MNVMESKAKPPSCAYDHALNFFAERGKLFPLTAMFPWFWLQFPVPFQGLWGKCSCSEIVAVFSMYGVVHHYVSALRNICWWLSWGLLAWRIEVASNKADFVNDDISDFLSIWNLKWLKKVDKRISLNQKVNVYKSCQSCSEIRVASLLCTHS